MSFALVNFTFLSFIYSEVQATKNKQSLHPSQQTDWHAVRFPFELEINVSGRVMLKTLGEHVEKRPFQVPLIAYLCGWQ